MARPVRELNHYHLPARIRAGKVPADGFSFRLALAERIAGLAGILTVEEESDTLPRHVEVFLQPLDSPDPHQHSASLLCKIGCEGICIYGLGEWDRHQVLRGGWGKLVRDHVEMYLPRDSEELEVCWAVLQRAHQYLSAISVQGRAGRKALVRNLPRFSRTTLQ
jgi:hypothetical protein